MQRKAGWTGLWSSLGGPHTWSPPSPPIDLSSAFITAFVIGSTIPPYRPPPSPSLDISNRISTSSIPSYINIIKLLHLEAGLPDPLQCNFHISSLLKGVQRQLAIPPNHKLPITPSILLQMHACLDLSRPILVSFWAACLVAFYSFFRKSTLLAKSPLHSCKTEFCIRDLIISPTSALLNVKHTKTLQFFNRLVQVPLPHIPLSPLCPISALHKLLPLLSGAPLSASLFHIPSLAGLTPI